MFRRLYSDGSKSIPSLQTSSVERRENKNLELNHSEVLNNGHVYANPSYSAAGSNTMQIGGLPFYLPRESASGEPHQKLRDIRKWLIGKLFFAIKKTAETSISRLRKYSSSLFYEALNFVTAHLIRSQVVHKQKQTFLIQKHWIEPLKTHFEYSTKQNKCFRWRWPQ